MKMIVRIKILYDAGREEEEENEPLVTELNV